MPKAKKDSVAISVRLDKNTFDRLAIFCDEAGQSKTTAIERALKMYIDDYDKKSAAINKHTTDQ